MRIVAFLGALSLALLPASAQIGEPLLSYAVDSGGALRPVLGIPAAARWGDTVAEGASGFACAAKLCLVKTDNALIAFGRGISAQSVPAPRGPALIAVEDRPETHGEPSQSGMKSNSAESAWIYFTVTQQMAFWHNGVLVNVDFIPDGQILSLRAAPDGFDYAVARTPAAADIWIEHYSSKDRGVSIIGPAAMPVDDLSPVSAALLFDGGVVIALGDQLVLNRSDGHRSTYPLPDASALYSVGRGYIEILASSGIWLLRTDPGREQVSMLPGPAKESIARPRGRAR